MTAAPTLALATWPAARAVPWAPLIFVHGALVVLAALTRGHPGGGTMPAVTCAAVAAACVFTLQDRGAALLAAVPTGCPMRRRLHRLSIVVAVAAPAWLLMRAVMPGVTGVRVPAGSRPHDGRGRRSGLDPLDRGGWRAGPAAGVGSGGTRSCPGASDRRATSSDGGVRAVEGAGGGTGWGLLAGRHR